MCVWGGGGGGGGGGGVSESAGAGKGMSDQKLHAAGHGNNQQWHAWVNCIWCPCLCMLSCRTPRCMDLPVRLMGRSCQNYP